LRNQILGIDPSEVHTSPVHATGTRAVDLGNPLQEYVYAKVSTAITQDDLVTFTTGAGPTLTAASIGAAAKQICGVRDQADVDGSTTAQYAWFLVRGLWSGASGLTPADIYSHLTDAGGALQASTTLAWGVCVTATSVHVLGWGNPGVAPLLLGLNPDHVHTEPVVAVGTRATKAGSANEYIYLSVPVSTAVAVGDFGICTSAYGWTSAGQGRWVAVTAVSSDPDNVQYAWFQTRGFNTDISNTTASALDAANTTQADGFILDTAGGYAFLF